MSFAGWIRYFLSKYCLKYISHIISPNWITDSPSGDALLKVISIVCRESKIFVLELYVITMIISTLDVYISLSHWNLRPFVNAETIFCVFGCLNVYMVLHLTTCPMMLLWSSTSMVTIRGVPKIWIYTYQDVQKNFVYAVSYIKAVCCGMTYPMSWKNPAHLMYFKTTIVLSLVDKSLIYMGTFICRFTLFNPLHISIMFLHLLRHLCIRS